MKLHLRSACLVMFAANVASAEAPVKDQGFTSELHRQHAGEIVFATHPIKDDTTTDPGFTNTLDLEAPLFLRVYLKESMGNTMRRAGAPCSVEPERSLHVQIGDAPKKEWISVAGARASRIDFDRLTTYPANENEDEALNSGKLTFDDSSSPRYTWATQVVPALAEGENKLTFHANAYCYDPAGSHDFEVATGTLTVTVRAGAREAFAKKHGPFFPKSHKVGGKDLAPRLRDLVARSWPEETVLAAAIVGTGWRVETDEMNVPVRRMLDGQVIVRRQNERTCRIFTVGMAQEPQASDDGNLTLFVGGSGPFSCPTMVK